MGRDSAVGIATRHGLDDPGIDYQLERVFRTRPDPASCTLDTGSFFGVGWGGVVKRSVRGGNHRTPSSAEVKERVEP